MVEFRRSLFSPAELEQSSEHFPLIIPKALPLLQTGESPWVIIEARLNNQLIGLTLSQVYNEGIKKSAQLHSFFVLPSHRGQGIGKKLFAYTEKSLQENEQIETLEFLYTVQDPSSPFIEKILASQGWKPPRTKLVRCHFDFTVFNPPWMHHSYKHPPLMGLFTWKNITPEDREHVEYLEKQGRFLSYLNPLEEESLIDRETSVGLRYKKKVVGWSVTHRLAPDTISYVSLFVDQAVVPPRFGIPLLSESLRRHKALGIPNAVFEVNARDIDHSWANFIKKRLFPLSDKIEQIKFAIRLYSPSN